MDMISLPQDFKEFLKLMNYYKIEYLLIGGFAVAYHGYPRATGDMDIWIAINTNNAKKMVNVLKDFGFNVPELSDDLFLRKKKVVRMGVPPIRIEILTDISGVKFDECYKLKICDVIDGIEMNIIDLKNLKKNKKASGRLRDLLDIENLP